MSAGTAAMGCTTTTVLLLVAGIGLYTIDRIGWAQACWVVASGLSGAAVVLWLDHTSQED